MLRLLDLSTRSRTHSDRFSANLVAGNLGVNQAAGLHGEKCRLVGPVGRNGRVVRPSPVVNRLSWKSRLAEMKTVASLNGAAMKGYREALAVTCWLLS